MRKLHILTGVITLPVLAVSVVLLTQPAKPVKLKLSAASQTIPKPHTQQTTQTTTSTSDTPTTAPVNVTTVIQTPAEPTPDQNKDAINALINTRSAALALDSRQTGLEVFKLDQYIEDSVGWNDYNAALAYPLLDQYLHPTVDSDGTVHYILIQNGRVDYIVVPPAT